MAEEKSKKPKIDLKARLAKTSLGNSGGAAAVPVPVPGHSGSGVPTPAPSSRPPLGPPPGISPGIPLPPFHRPAPAPSKPTAAQQTIKVEIGEEIHEERRKASKKVMAYAAGAAVVGIIVGFVAGESKAKGDRFGTATEGALALEKEIKAANDKMHALDEKLQAATESLASKKYPVDLAKDLGGINIPFDSLHLDNRGLGGYPTKVLKPLLAYTSAVEDLNKDKDSLKNLIGAAQPVVEKAWKEESDPVASFSVIFASAGKGVVAELVKNKDPFPLSKDWPDSYQVMKPERSQQGTKEVEKKANRWKKGELTGGGDPPAIPVEPSSSAAFTSQEVVFKLTKALHDMRVRMQGDKENPQAESAGLLKDGDDLASALHSFATAK